jgi:hypothetical protein
MNQMGKVNEFEGSGNVYFQLDIEGEKSTTEPVSVNCEFGIANGQLTEPSKNQKIKNLSLTGVYSNDGGIAKEFLSLKKINFTTAYGPFAGNLHVSNFNAPLLKGNATGNLNLTMLHSLFHFPQIDKINGDLMKQRISTIKSQKVIETFASADSLRQIKNKIDWSKFIWTTDYKVNGIGDGFTEYLISKGQIFGYAENTHPDEHQNKMIFDELIKPRVIQELSS